MAGFYGLARIQRAKQLLETDDLPTGERLVEALQTFWSASICYAFWPPEFQQRADAIHRLMLQNVTIRQTAAHMDEQTVEQLRELIGRFAEKAEAHHEQKTAQHSGLRLQPQLH